MSKKNITSIFYIACIFSGLLICNICYAKVIPVELKCVKHYTVARGKNFLGKPGVTMTLVTKGIKIEGEDIRSTDFEADEEGYIRAWGARPGHVNVKAQCIYMDGITPVSVGEEFQLFPSSEMHSKKPNLPNFTCPEGLGISVAMLAPTDPSLPDPTDDNPYPTSNKYTYHGELIITKRSESTKPKEVLTTRVRIEVKSPTADRTRAADPTSFLGLEPAIESGGFR